MHSLGGDSIVNAMQPHKRKSVPLTKENLELLQMLETVGKINEFKKDEEQNVYKFIISN